VLRIIDEMRASAHPEIADTIGSILSQWFSRPATAAVT